MEINRENYRPRHLMVGTSVFDKNMKLSWYDGTGGDLYMIPLNKEILEPLGFEAVYDEFTGDIYFQRDIQSVRVRVFPMGTRIAIIDLKCLHTLVDVKAEGLNELENYLNCLGFNLDSIIDKKVEEAINDFGQRCFEYYEVRAEMIRNLSLRDEK